MKKKLAVMALAAATLSMMAMPVYADDLVTVGHEKETFSENLYRNHQPLQSQLQFLSHQ